LAARLKQIEKVMLYSYLLNFSAVSLCYVASFCKKEGIPYLNKQRNRFLCGESYELIEEKITCILCVVSHLVNMMENLHCYFKNKKELSLINHIRLGICQLDENNSLIK
jgi:hypothetical protein